MAQKSENFRFEGKYAEYIPAASTAVAAGDAVILVNGALEVATATKAVYKDFVGFSDDAWSSKIALQMYGVSATDYASPTTRPHKIKVYHEGVFDLAIRETSGTAGQAVYLLTATTGAQVFTVDPVSVAAETVMGPVGFLYETFSGATTEDCQKVRITAGLQNNPRDLRWTLMNRLVSWSGAGGATNTLHGIVNSMDGATGAITVGKIVALVNGVLIGVGSDCDYGTGCYANDGCGSVVVIWGLNSAGSWKIFYDSAKATLAVARATMMADQFYWPSVTLDYLPIALALGASDDSYISGTTRVIFRTIADCLRVS